MAADGRCVLRTVVVLVVAVGELVLVVVDGEAGRQEKAESLVVRLVESAGCEMVVVVVVEGRCGVAVGCEELAAAVLASWLVWRCGESCECCGAGVRRRRRRWSGVIMMVVILCLIQHRHL